MSTDPAPALQAALDQILSSLDGEPPPEALEAIEEILATPPESEEQFSGMVDALRATLARVAELASEPLSELTADLDEADVDAIRRQLPEVDPETFHLFHQALQDPEAFLQGSAEAIDKAIDEQEEWAIISETYDMACTIATSGYPVRALQLAIAARTRAREVAPEFEPRGSLTIGFIHEQSGDVPAALRAYRHAYDRTSTNRDLAGIAARAALGMARLLEWRFDKEKQAEYLSYAWTVGTMDSDASLIMGVTLLASDVTANAGDLNQAVRHLVEGRVETERLDGDVTPLTDALESLSQRYGEQRIFQILEEIESHIADEDQS